MKSKPDEKLVNFVSELINAGFKQEKTIQDVEDFTELQLFWSDEKSCRWMCNINSITRLRPKRLDRRCSGFNTHSLRFRQNDFEFDVEILCGRDEK